MKYSIIKKVQYTELEIMKVIDQICEKENIKYYMCAGTLLGAVRHKGFIPWDDDLDIMLLRDDYLRLMTILEKELPKEYWLQNYDTDPNYWQPYAKVRKKILFIKKKEWKI